MTQVKENKFEQLLELLINEENDKAEQLFHEIVVEKSRDIYEGLAESEDNTDETVEETSEEKATDEAVDEASKEKATDEAVDEEVEIEDEATEESKENEEESIEEVGGDATDELIKDISADQEGDADQAADDMAQDMEPAGEEGETEDRIDDLEDALDDLKAEFEKMMGNDGEEEKEEESLSTEAPVEADVIPMEAKKDKMEADKETVKEYKIPKTADTGDHADVKKSPVASNAKSPNSASPVKTDSKEDAGRPAPTSQTIKGEYANHGGKDSLKTSEVKADHKDGTDASNKKSPVASK